MEALEYGIKEVLTIMDITWYPLASSEVPPTLLDPQLLPTNS